MRPAIQGALLAVSAAILFGLVNVASRASALPPLVQGAYAYLLAGVLLAPSLRGLRVERADWPKVLAMSIVGGGLAPALLFYGLTRANAADASILLTFEVVFTAILATIVLRERPGARAWAGMLLLFASAILVAVLAGARGGETSLVGSALVLLAALGWGIDNTLSARLVGSYKPQQLVAVKGLVGGGTALVAAMLVGDPLGVPLDAWRYVIYIGVLGVAASVYLFYQALGRIGATLTAGIFLPMGAVAGVLGGWILLDEALGPFHLVAALLALAGVYLAISKRA